MRTAILSSGRFPSSARTLCNRPVNYALSKFETCVALLSSTYCRCSSPHGCDLLLLLVALLIQTNELQGRPMWQRPSTLTLNAPWMAFPKPILGKCQTRLGPKQIQHRDSSRVKTSLYSPRPSRSYQSLAQVCSMWTTLNLDCSKAACKEC